MSQVRETDCGLRRRLIILVFVGLAFGLIAVRFHRNTPAFDPSYQGGRLSEWIVLLTNPVRTNYLPGLNYYSGVEFKPPSEVRSAFEFFETNAVPYLRRELRANDSPVMNAVLKCIPGLWSALKRNPPALVRRRRAVLACNLLGRDAQALIPELAVLMESNPNPVDESRALVRAGPESIPVFICALTNQQTGVRAAAAHSLRYFSANVREGSGAALPGLLKCLDDAEPAVRAEAAVTLGIIRENPAAVIPALLENLHHEHPQVRAGAASALGCFKDEASAAVPLLVRLAREEPNASARLSAKEALRRIDPQAATEFGR